MEQEEKRCGNCRWFNYKGERGVEAAMCEAYSLQRHKSDRSHHKGIKSCSSWKEENIWQR